VANEIKFTVKFKKDGSLKEIAADSTKAAKGTEKLSEATEKTTKSRNRYKKGEKGVAQAGLSSAKSFSKMQQTMVGGGGLVGAYATLAANVFALTAAFGILQRASAANQLAEGLEYTGRVAGRNLPYIAGKLKEITGNAVSTAEAMSTVAIATSSGFSGDQIMKLGEVARGASLALGRDMTDALSRLVRGSAKLEPELLDELGIMVRLDDASQQYATQLGVTVGSLTQYQKRQAFANAVIREGQQAFAGIGETIDPNAYDQLGAALQDLLKDTAQFINKGLEPMAKFLAGSRTGMVAGVALFASTIRGALLPSLSKGADEMSKFAAGLQKAAKSSMHGVKTTGQLPKIYKDLVEKIKDGSATTEQMATAQTSLNNSLVKHNADLVHNSTLQDVNTAKYATKIGVIEGVAAAQTHLLSVQAAAAVAAKAEAVAMTMQLAAQGNIIGAMKQLKVVYKAHIVASLAMSLSNGVAAKSFLGLRAAMFAARTGVIALGTAILVYLPWLAAIGLAIAAAMFAYERFFGNKENVDDSNEIADTLEHLSEVSNELAVSLARIHIRNPPNKEWQIFTTKLKAASGAANQLRDRMGEIISSQMLSNQKKYGDALEAQNIAEAAYTKATKTPGSGKKHTEELAAAFVEASLKTKALGESINDIDTAPLARGLQTTLKAISGQEGMEDLEERVKALINGLGALEKIGFTSAEQLSKLFSGDSIDNVAAGLLDELNGNINKLKEGTAKLGAKVATPFDEISDSLSGAEQALTQTIGSTDKLTRAQQKLIDGIKDPNSDISKKMLKFKEGTETAAQTVIRLNKAVKANVKIIQEAPGRVKEQTAALKKLSVVRKIDLATSKAAHIIEDEILQTKYNAIQAIIDNYKKLGQTVEKESEITKHKADQAAIIESAKTVGQKHLENVQAEIGMQKLIVNMQQKALSMSKDKLKNEESRLRMQLADKNAADVTRGYSRDLNAADELKVQEGLIEMREDGAREEANIAMARIEMEFALLKAQAGLLKEKTVVGSAARASVDDYITLLGTTQNDMADQVEENLKTTIKNINVKKPKAEVRADVLAAEGGSAYEVLQNQATAGGEEGLKNEKGETALSDKVKLIGAVMKPMEEALRRLGPEGELIAQVSAGGMAIGETISLTMEKFEGFTKTTSKMEKGAAIASAVASTIGQIAQIQSAASAARVAGIDKEIAAEQKRDGKSKASLAKIKALEAKKEAEKKKAFETNKKMLMAQTVANTAAGIMSAVAKDGALGIAMAVLIGAMGVAQLAIISGTSYQGGAGAGGGAAIPSSVSVGKRGTSSDLGKSQSARGELAYFRGEEGTGGAENFKSSFYGSKHRASGGNTGYVVGEQGPELFMPDRPGTIVPADDAAVAGGSTNVNFSINAIDAAGVEDVLMEQQGNIIGMLRQAANSYGQDFMEDVDESTYTAPAARRA